MKTVRFVGPRGLLVSAFVALALAVPVARAADNLPPVAKPNVNTPVTITDGGANWVMDNGIIKATIVKKNGSLLQVVYHGIETLRPAISN